MYEFEADHNNLITGIVNPKMHVAWSRRRAWHGETVVIQVRTELVNDGTEVKLEIRDENKKAVDTFEKEIINGNKLDKNYKIDWTDKKLKEEPYKFLVKATIADPAIRADSGPLAVDLHPPLFSA